MDAVKGQKWPLTFLVYVTLFILKIIIAEINIHLFRLLTCKKWQAVLMYFMQKNTVQKKETVRPSELTFHHDAGHGWLAVPFSLILPILHEVSSFSYYNGSFVYLEEDCDLSLFIRYMGWMKGETLDFNDVYDGDHSFIRDLKHIGGNYMGKGANT